MYSKNIIQILSKWEKELAITLSENKSFCLALFSIKKELLFANELMLSLFKGEAHQSFINPSFDELLASNTNSNGKPVFNGFLTVGDYSSINTSILVNVYRKDDKLLIVGGFNAELLLQQNQNMHELNKMIGNLQRQLISEKNNLEVTLDKLNEANQELKNLNIDKDRFISILAHDLKNPFNAILGLSDYLLKSLRELEFHEIEEQLNVISKTGYQTYHLLEDLLMWTKSQSGKLSFNPKEFNINEVCIEIIGNFKPQATTKRIKIGFQESKYTNIIADKNMIKNNFEKSNFQCYKIYKH